jgi:hypothetical protein
MHMAWSVLASSTGDFFPQIFGARFRKNPPSTMIAVTIAIALRSVTKQKAPGLGQT